ncbi:hypothetical protein Tco_1222496 [Tanacetum coccineum]
MDSVEKAIVEIGWYKKVDDNKVNERTMQPQEGMVNMVKDKCDVGLVVKESNRTELEKQDESSSSRNDTRTKGADINLSNDRKPLNETIAQKDFSKLEAQSIAFEISLQHKTQENNSLKTMQKENEIFLASLQIENAHLKQTYKDLFESIQSSKVETNQCDKVKVKVNFDEIETKNTELEHQVASLIRENEHLKLVYKNLFDSIKKSQVQIQKENLRSTLCEFAIVHILGKDDSSSSSIAKSHISELEKVSGENNCENAKCELRTKIVKLEKVPDTEDTIKFMLGTQQFTYTVDMFRDTLHLPVETPKNPFVAPTNINTIETFMNRVDYQDKDQHSSDAVLNQTHVDYADLLWWDFMNNVFQKKEAIQYPQFIKLIVADLMKKFLNISKRIDEDYHSIKDGIPLVSMYTTRNVLVRGMLIPDAFLTAKIRETNDFKEYETVFMKIDVPMNQLQPVISTQGTHKITPSAQRSPTISVSTPVSKKRKQIAGESNSPRKSLKITIKQKQIVKKDNDDFEDMIEPERIDGYAKDFDDVKLELSNRTTNFEAYFEKLENKKVVLERQLARKVIDSKVKNDQFLIEINHLRAQLENLKGKFVETKFDKP